MRLGNELAVDLYRYISRCPRRMDGRRHKQGGQKLAGYRPLDADRLIRTDVAPTYRQRRIIRITQITDIGTQNKQRIDQVAYGPLVHPGNAGPLIKNGSASLRERGVQDV